MNSPPPLESGSIPISAPFYYYSLPASMKISLAKNVRLHVERLKAVQQAVSNSLDKYPSDKIIDSDIKDAPCPE